MIAIFWWRAGSIHAVLDRLWRLVAGKADANDPVLKAMLQESRDIEKFQYTYRLKAETLAAIHKLDAWTKAHNVGLSRLLRIRRWVDLTSPEIVLQPPKRYVPLHLGIALVAVSAFAAIGPMAATPNAYLQMRASKTWFKTDGTSVKAIREGWSIDQSSCAKDRPKVALTTGFNEKESEMICRALKEDGLRDFVKKTVTFQAWTGVVAALAAAIFALSHFLAACSATNAAALRKRLARTTADNSNSQAITAVLAANDTAVGYQRGSAAAKQDEVGSALQP